MNIEGNKIGGASLIGAPEIQILPALAKNFVRPSFLTVSAFKDQTNRLEILAGQVADKKMEEAEKTFHEIFNHHYRIALQLFPMPNEIVASMTWIFNDLYKDINLLKHTENTGLIYDQIVGKGEMISAKIVSGFLNSHGVGCKLIDATKVIVTDSSWKSAKVDFEETAKKAEGIFTKEFWSENNLVVIAGFIGGTFHEGKHYTTTLGREGSDKTAAIMAYLLGATRLNFWKDVDGLYDSDPKTNKQARLIERASYPEVRKMKEEGRIKGLVHDDALDLLEEKGIVYCIRNTKKPDAAGTVIGA